MHPPLGPYFDAEKTCHFTLWAPQARQVTLEITAPEPRSLPMKALPHGYWTLALDDAAPGTRYLYRLDDQEPRPDPASRYQPEGVHGHSAVVDLAAHEWEDTSWWGLPQTQWILYELHVGTFTPEGTFAAAIARLDDLVDLGINVIELMPVSQFPGGRNWGYDGVYPFATAAAYGGPAGLMAFVDACHERGLAVILDVVYNHQGPEGNYLSHYGPYFTDRYQTPWGQALNFDGPQSDGVRHFYLENARMWLRDFHLDGFRLDAVHAIKDLGARHFLQELTEEVEKLRETTGRFYVLIGECDLNDRRYLTAPAVGGYGLHGQWIDEFHHAVHALLTGEKLGYYEDFGSLSLLAKAYNHAYVYDGGYSPHRQKTFGSSAEGLPGKKFVAFIQNHDQVGNRMLGDRLHALVDLEAYKLAVGMLFLSPYLPLLFMGEEYGETQPFQYFVSHGDPALIEAVRKGRKAEFAAFHAEGEAPDPQAEETFGRSTLSWDWSHEPHRTLRNYYRQWIYWRKHHPVLSHPDRKLTRAWADEARQVLQVLRGDPSHQLIAWMNAGDIPQTLHWSEARSGQLLLNTATPVWLGNGAELPSDLRPGEPFRLEPKSMVMFELREEMR